MIGIFIVVGMRCVVLGATSKLRPGDKIVGIRDEQIALRVESVAAPGHATDVSRHHERTLLAGWSEDSFVAEFADGVLTELAVGGCQAPSIVGGELMRGERRRGSWKRLRGGSGF